MSEIGKFDKFKFSDLIDHIREPILILDKTGIIIAVNKEALSSTDYTLEELINRNFNEFILPDDKDYVTERFLTRVNDKESRSQEFFSRIIDKEKRVRNILLSSNQIINEDEVIGLWINIKIENISGKFSEFFLRVQEISQNIAGTLEITELLTKICESIGRILNFPLVYVSLIHPQDKELYPVAWNGNTRYFLKYENFVNLHTEKEIPEYHVLREGKILTINSIKKDPDQFLSWKKILSEENYNSYIGFPINLGNVTEGVLNIFSEREYCFGDIEQVDSLKTLTNFITVAIKNSRLFNKIIQAEERYRGLFYESPNGLCIITKDQNIAEINSKFLNQLGYSVKDLKVLSDFKKFLSKKDYRRFNDIFTETSKGKKSNFLESIIERKD
ncbi:MAG TPA: PAS domain S-box protein, partial [Firmicutes bacterium]|nr:PAS domain S-box protein [Bacillota bacterium]